MSSSSTRNSKRRRKNSPVHDPSHAPVAVRRGMPWFDDGNIVLQSCDGVQFKVYKGLLAHHSTVFEDITSSPQPKVHGDIAEGCPLVILIGTGADLSTFLCLLSSRQVFFDCSIFIALQNFNFSFNACFTTGKITFQELRVMLQLGKKYRVSSLRNGAITRLRAEFPDTLDAHDKSSDILSSIDPDTCFLKEIAQLAWEEDIQIVLPDLFYSAINLSNADEFLRDNSVPLQFKAVLMAGTLFAFKEQSNIAFTWLRNDDIDHISQCEKASSCRNALHTFARLHFGWGRQTRERGLQRLSNWSSWPPSKLCDSCINSIDRRHEAERRAFWEALPSFFDLPSWEELREAADKL
ncbi:hypothetical protein DL96DRAFT_1822838 [Flagelloscypha sp. PMI_526]|nr:hypothetical protein DL96DRAFT_1822838 [Flagelloscypha sp. PMI_526]